MAHFSLSTDGSRALSSSWDYSHYRILTFIMTLEEVQIQKPQERDQCVGQALEDVLVSAKDNDALTVGVHECAKVMNL